MNNFTHEQLGERLQALAIAVAPDYLHGVMAGLACAGLSTAAPAWLTELAGCLPDVDLTSQPELFAALQALCERSLQQEDLSFQPLLPADEEFLSLRMQAMAQWCDGFVQAYLAGSQTQDAEVRETIDDLYAISQMDVSEEYNEPAEAHTHENDFVELCEYVRMSVMSLYADRPALATPAEDNA